MLHKTIESVLERGEKIDSLVEKSDGLSAQSKMFYSKSFVSFVRSMQYLNIVLTSSITEQAKQQNSCCIIM